MEVAEALLFAGLPAGAWRDVLRRMRRRRFVAGAYVGREGDVSDRLYLIQDCVVEVIVGEGASAQMIGHLRRGDIFGEMGTARPCRSGWAGSPTRHCAICGTGAISAFTAT